MCSIREAHPPRWPRATLQARPRRDRPATCLAAQTTSAGELAETAWTWAMDALPGFPGAACSSLTAGPPAATDHKYSHATAAYRDQPRPSGWGVARTSQDRTARHRQRDFSTVSVPFQPAPYRCGCARCIGRA
jgi:hypothetical protein